MSIPFKAYKTFYTLLLIPLLVTLSVFSYFVFSKEVYSLYDEGHLMENLQVAFIFISGVLFLLETLSVNKPYTWYTLSLSLLAYSFLLRELDVENFQLPEMMIALGSGTGRNIMLAIGWVGSIMYFFLHWQAFKNTLWSFFKSSSGQFLLLAALSLFIGALFDRQIVILEHAVFFEEATEIAGYYFMILAALMLPYSLHKVSIIEMETQKIHISH